LTEKTATKKNNTDKQKKMQAYTDQLIDWTANQGTTFFKAGGKQNKTKQNKTKKV
jgi:hypothetical protein